MSLPRRGGRRRGWRGRRGARARDDCGCARRSGPRCSDWRSTGCSTRWCGTGREARPCTAGRLTAGSSAGRLTAGCGARRTAERCVQSGKSPHARARCRSLRRGCRRSRRVGRCFSREFRSRLSGGARHQVREQREEQQRNADEREPERRPRFVRASAIRRNPLVVVVLVRLSGVAGRRVPVCAHRGHFSRV